MAWVNANRLHPEVNAYVGVLILPSDGHRQMPVAASSLPTERGAPGLALGGQLAPLARLPHSFTQPTHCLLLLPPWQLCPPACTSWHTVLPSRCLWPPPCPAPLLMSWSPNSASLTALLQLPHPPPVAGLSHPSCPRGACPLTSSRWFTAKAGALALVWVAPGTSLRAYWDPSVRPSWDFNPVRWVKMHGHTLSDCFHLGKLWVNVYGIFLILGRHQMMWLMSMLSHVELFS